MVNKRNEYFKAYQKRANVKVKIKKWVKARFWKIHAKKKQYWIDQKGSKCSLCGGVFELPCYDFHHINPKEKEGKLFNFYGYSNGKLGIMLQNCILLCANCHRLLHFKERQK